MWHMSSVFIFLLVVQFKLTIMVLSPNYLKQIASLLKVKIDKISFNGDALCTCLVKEKSVSGVINIVNALLRESKSTLSASSPLEKSEIHQWIEYVLVYVVQIDSNSQNLNAVLKELNSIFATKTYLVSYRLTIADVLLYYTLLNVMASLSNIEKEKYMHLSRWFDNLQVDLIPSQLKQTPINFNSNYLVSVAPARH